jgi:hypothetical protein
MMAKSVRKAARTKKRKVAAKKATMVGKRRAASKKTAAKGTRRAAGRKAAAPKKRRKPAAKRVAKRQPRVTVVPAAPETPAPVEMTSIEPSLLPAESDGPAIS